MKSRLQLSRSAAVIAVLLLMSCGGEGFRVQVNFPHTNDLKRGSQVRYRGVPVGEVQQVVLRPAADGKATEAIATLVIRDKQVVLRESDTFHLATAGLIGESAVNISPGSSGSPQLRPDSTVEGIVSPEFPLTDAKNLSTIFGLLELTTRMSKLPPEKRDAVMNEFHSIVEKALEEQARRMSDTATSDKKR